eukprot:COSAG06_NODE_3305_length_5530_cov_2.400110_2_plen_141_part_00
MGDAMSSDSVSSTGGRTTSISDSYRDQRTSAWCRWIAAIDSGRRGGWSDWLYSCRCALALLLSSKSCGSDSLVAVPQDLNRDCLKSVQSRRIQAIHKLRCLDLETVYLTPARIARTHAHTHTQLYVSQSLSHQGIGRHKS